MHFRRKRIVHFVVKQIPALFAHGSELLYRIIFFFKTHCCHEFLQATTPKLKCCRSAPPKSFSAKGTGSMTRWRSQFLCGHQKNYGEISPPDRSSCCEIP